MLRPEFSTHPAALPVGADAIAAPAFGGATAGAFSALMNEVRGEIEQFIESGSPASSLSAAGLAHRLRVQARPSADGMTAARGAADGLGALDGLGVKALAIVDDAGQQAFLDAIAPAAREAGRRLGVAPQLVAAQAALESGWGQRPLRSADGGDSHNLFGIKAGSAWRGAVAEARTTEFEDGVAVQRNERFRSYPDQASAFRDFTRLLLDNPRYRGALDSGDDARAYAQGLMAGGYATDPAYADKLVRLAAQLRRRD